MWLSLPSNLRTVLGVALLLGLGVGAAAFTLSFFALRDAAQDPALAWGAGHAWLFPIGIDMALVFFEVLLIGASMVRVQERGRSVPYPRAVPFLLMLVAAAGTLYFNAIHVPEQVRLLALAVPVASILVTLGLAYLLKMLARTSGADYIYEAPVEADPRKLVRAADVLEAEIVRGSAQVTHGQTDITDGRGSGGDQKTKAAILATADNLGTEEVRAIGPGGLVAAVADNYGIRTTGKYVRQVLSDAGWTTGRNGHGKS